MCDGVVPCVFAKAKGDERKRIVRMRMALVMGSPFYGLLAMKLKLVKEPAIKTAGTEGKHLLYNPEYIAGMSDAKLKGAFGTSNPLRWSIWSTA